MYPLKVLHNHDQHCIIQFKKLMFQFLWDNKPEKNSRENIIQDYCHGGLKMLDIETFIQSLKCSWVKRLKLQHDSKLVQLDETMLNKYGQQFIFECNLNTKDTEKLKMHSIFLKDILLAWSCLNFRNDITNIGKEIVWNNSNIKSNIKPFFLREWLNKGIIFIEHIYDYRNKQF